MAFSMSGMSSAFGGNTRGPTIHQGDDVPELPEIRTEEIGFKGLNGDKKAKILSEPWPADNLPPPYASLLSIASARGLYAAAGPSNLVLGKTQDIRNKIYSDNKGQDIFDCPPIQTFPHQRLAHVAFASDESCLVVSEQVSSEIVAYDVGGLQAGNQNFKITISTDAPVRAIAPNPDPQQAYLFALLNTNGQLLLANLQGKGELQSGTNGPILAENVTCVTWSTKGKQLLAGKADGTALQIKPDGTVVASIPKPDSVPDGCHLAQIVWTETDVFVFVYTPSSVSEDESPESHYCVVKANKDRSDLTFHKTAYDLVFATIPRTPACFHTARLRDYGPSLDELICITASVSPDIKMLTKSQKPLSGEINAENAYTVTIPDNESLQASMPMNQDSSQDTTAIGIAIDLSDNEPIVQPIVGDPEVSTSEGPLPLLVALNNEGVLLVWVVAYNDAIREKIPYPGFKEVMERRNRTSSGPNDGMSMDTQAQQSITNQGPSTLSTTPKPVPSSSNSQQGGFVMPTTSSNTGGFSKPTPIGGETKSSWTSTGFGSNQQNTSSGFGASGFGTTPALGSNSAPAFGQTGSIGGSGQQAASTPAFGKTGFGTAMGQSSPFASAGNSSSSPFANAGSKTSSGFSSFANQNGFGAVKSDTKASNTFSSFSSGGGFGPAGGFSSSSAFGSSKPTNASSQASTASTFGKPSPLSSGTGASATSTVSPFGGLGKPGFKLDSTFQKDETSKDNDKPDDGGGIGFGGFGNMLGGGSSKLSQTTSKEADMEDDSFDTENTDSSKRPQETPPSTINQPKMTTTPHVSSLFGSQQHSTTPPTQQKLGTGWNFSSIPSTTPKDTPAPSRFMFNSQTEAKNSSASVGQGEPSRTFGPSSTSKDAGQQSSSKAEDERPPTKMPEAPLPPDPFSKPEYQTGDTSASSLNSKTSREGEDAPLPPDFVSTSKPETQTIKAEDSALPPDSVSSEFPESGDDLDDELSGDEEHESGQSAGEDETEQIQTSPESSLGQITDQSPVASPAGGPFTKVSKIESTKPTKPLFGELGQGGPIFMPPKPKPQEIPRSPSPVRKSASNDLFRQTDRSVSAPAGPKSFLQQKKAEHQQSPFAVQAAQARAEEAEREAARIAAARKAREEAEAQEQQPLVDDEDAIIRMALAQDPEPKEKLDPFMTIQPVKALQDINDGRINIHSQVEKLYEDINSMVNTLGINARSLQEYMMYQKDKAANEAWPDVLSSDTPMDALNDELFLCDINSLPAGCVTLDEVLGSLEIKDMLKKLDDCQSLLTQELVDLRARITVLRRTTQARAQADNNMHAPLSAEQLSIQQDLRKSSASVLSNLGQIEEDLVVLRAKLADLMPSQTATKGSDMFAMGSIRQKKPSVEAVVNTVTKMMAMAEKKSADVDVLEAKLRKLNMDSRDVQVQPQTPERRINRKSPNTPASGTSSVYHTPESGGPKSSRATPSRNQQLLVSAEDREKWKNKARKRRDVASSLKAALQAKHGKATA